MIIVSTTVRSAMILSLTQISLTEEMRNLLQTFLTMNWKLVCEVGFKVLTATVAGAAIFVGISRSLTESGGKKPLGGDETEGPKTQANPFIQEPPRTDSPTSTQSQMPQGQANPYDEPKILRSVRATQDTCGKLFAFVQSLTMVTENLTRIFGSKAGPQVMQFPGYGPQCYGGNPWSYRQPVNVGDQTWTRISPFIIEAGPAYTNGRGCYPYC